MTCPNCETTMEVIASSTELGDRLTNDPASVGADCYACPNCGVTEWRSK